MRSGFRFMAAAVAALFASSSTAVHGQAIIVFRRSLDVLPSLRGQMFKKKADKDTWNRNLHRAQSSSRRGGSRHLHRAQSSSRRGGSRPVARGR